MPDEEAGPDAKHPPEIVVTSNALQVAKGWVRNMIGGSDSDSDPENSSTAELEARAPRLGLGAKYLPHSQVAATLTPVERKLRAMTSAGKQGEGRGRIGNLRYPLSTVPTKESKSAAESDEEEEEVKGSSRIPQERQQKRSTPADLLMKTSGSKGKGRKRKR